ncbi:MAG TPA: acetyl-CoA carboxylase biotin carboxyl carrier protein, partial [Gemmatimonadales bacterium]|nr:acetyl-CoA carboxylase biotin carboxyl carrier protein [Gemmatimonadales bacterium]
NPKDAQDLAKVLAKQPGIRSVDLKDVRKLAELLQEFPEIGSIEVKGWFDTGVTITRTGNSNHVPGPVAMAMQHPVMAPPPPAPVSAPAAAAAPAAPAGGALKDIKSPMVGTFYKSPEPGAEAYVKVGGRVTQGQTVCIIEAMKIMNEIEAEVTGVVREVLVEDSQPVEFGTVLFRVDPNG